MHTETVAHGWRGFSHVAASGCPTALHMLGLRDKLVACLISLAIWPLAAAAAEQVQVTGAEQLIERLQVRPESQSGMQSRGIVVKASDPNQGRVALSTIQFEHDSATLTSDSAGQLQELGRAMGDPRLLNESFVIEGHTDAYGDARYNQALSLRRADAVRKYLIGKAGIAADRLTPVGRGETRPKTTNPHDPENRRVEITNRKVHRD